MNNVKAPCIFESTLKNDVYKYDFTAPYRIESTHYQSYQCEFSLQNIQLSLIDFYTGNLDFHFFKLKFVLSKVI